MEGLRLLPWVQLERDKMAEAGSLQGSREYLDCGTCRASRQARRGWRCGFIPEAEHGPRYLGAQGDGASWPLVPTVCPGYTTSLPEVYEVARARKWSERGKLPPERLRDLIDVLDAECSATDRARMQTRKGGG